MINVLYSTACGHLVRLPKGQDIGKFRCRVCGKWTRIIRVQTEEWHARCQVPRCPFSAWTGLSRALANEAANRHYQNTRTHYIIVKLEKNPIAVEEETRLRKGALL